MLWRPLGRPWKLLRSQSQVNMPPELWKNLRAGHGYVRWSVRRHVGQACRPLPMLRRTA